MTKILILNGPNINLIGKREVDIYGSKTFEEIKNECIKKGNLMNLSVDFRQSNSEGQLIDWLHLVNENFGGLIMNPAGYTHTSISILDSLKAINKPKIEIHISNIYSREEFRKKSITSEGMDGLISGFGINSYALGLKAIKDLINNGK